MSALVLGLVTLGGTLAYAILGLSPLDALYQTVTTISTVGFREYGEPTTAWKITTLVVILVGAGSALYTLGVFLETLVEGRLTDRIGHRRAQRRIASMEDHVIVCGWGGSAGRSPPTCRAPDRTSCSSRTTRSAQRVGAPDGGRRCDG